ncbi:MAG TPA: ComEC/Rec2 family competence protein [Terracidiphilus sp.]|nr:ComEC/Rec2 family competence protein [Terracidiphilus sp.]
MRSFRSISVQPGAGFSAVPLFHAAWLFALGIVAARSIWLRPSLTLLALLPVAGLCALAALRAQRIAWLPMALMWVLLGAWCCEMEPHPSPARPLDALSDGLLRTVEGTIINTGPVRTEMEQNVNEPSIAEPSQRVDVRVNSLEAVNDVEDTQEPATGAVRLTIRWPAGIAAAEPLRCGQRMRAVVRLLPPQVYRDPGVWSRADYLLDQGITSTSSVKAADVQLLGASTAASLACRLSAWQHATAARLLGLPAKMRGLPSPLRLSADDTAMLAAMVAGDRTYLTQNLRAGFERTGSFHMLVVSGFHLAIVAGCIFWITRKLRMPRVPETLITLLGSLAYAMFTGFATPVQRALWMIAIYMLGRMFYRERNAMNTIGFAALCLLVASPRSLFDSSFQMTLLAVVVIAGIAAPLLEATVHPYLSATRNLELTALDIKLPPAQAQYRVYLRMAAARLQSAPSRRFAWRVFPWCLRFSLRGIELIAVSLVVELAMTLPMAIYFHRITLFALPVNLLILPLLAVLLPAALLMLLLLVVWPAAAIVPALMVAGVLHFSLWLVHLFGSLTLGNLRVATPLLWQTAAFYVLLGAAIGFAASRIRLLRPAAWAALLLAGFVAAAPRPIQHPRDALLMEAIDVGQGDSLLLITPDGKTLLVDGGGFGGGPRSAAQNFDIGEEVVSPALWARGIRHLDAVAITHAHSDHIGGLPSVLRNFHPAELWVGNNPPIPAYEALLAEASGLHTRLRSFRAGDVFTFGGTRIEVLAPFRSYQPGPDPSNNDSMVLHVTYGASSALLEGDAEQPIEQAMLSERDLASTLLKVGHHGSNTSTQPGFLARVAPQWAVISCGLHNRYRHPHQGVLEELQAAHVRTYITAVNGITCFRLDGSNTTADPGCGLP